jgi:hypothetical protein
MCVHDADALAGDEMGEPGAVPVETQRIERIDGHRQLLAAEGAQFGDQRAAFAGDHRPGAGLQQRQCDIDRGGAHGIVA